MSAHKKRHRDETTGEVGYIVESSKAPKLVEDEEPEFGDPDEPPMVVAISKTPLIEEDEQFNESALEAPGQPTGTQSSQKKHAKKKKVFPFGNYIGYYKYRLESNHDPRLDVLQKEWFEDKEVLDIGCNSGVFTIELAHMFPIKSIEGFDIDSHLIKMAEKNLSKWYKDHKMAPSEWKQLDKIVSFRHENAVKPNSDPSNAALHLSYNNKQYDVILCLSVVKWVHLNWGDGGLRTLFARFQKQLRPNGLLILEIQPWSSYKKKKAMTADTYKHFKEIKMRPNQFPEVLEKEYGLKLERRLEPPTGSAEGFDRPIDVFRNVGVEPQK